jgi:hypothetical protein
LRGYNHQSVDHRARQYVVGAIHTNTIEAFWSIFKRSIVGSYHKVSAKYLPLYIAELRDASIYVPLWHSKKTSLKGQHSSN